MVKRKKNNPKKKTQLQKSLNSFGEIGADFLNGLESRNEKKLDSFYDFGNYLTIGAFDGIKGFGEGLNERADKATDSVYDFGNYLTIGALDISNNTFNPDEPFSKEHWTSSLSLAALFAGGVKPIGAQNSPIKQVGKEKGSKPEANSKEKPDPKVKIHKWPAVTLVERWRRLLNTTIYNLNLNQLNFVFADGLGGPGRGDSFDGDTGKDHNIYRADLDRDKKKTGGNSEDGRIEGTGDLKYKEGYYIEHLTGEVKKCTKRHGVSGGHNYDEFKEYFHNNRQYKLEEVKKIEHPDIKGVYDIEYRLKVEIKDYQGQGTGEFKFVPKEG
ncbi:CdiA family toxin C-terminal domain-containing protein [Metabacillus arenae]|uniref:CdiA family toxin C-terminal domain-containing protein n=1 Tax=Metabacillus arenae TaxID=2771434 RepID=UPI001CD08CED|nr:CdiA family toxin C-terminal domain-containing protein [Metabacillus arenae]